MVATIVDAAMGVETRKIHSSARHFRLIQRTLENNKGSDYTEKIEALGKSFDYQLDGSAPWGPAELSSFYGTPLYSQATEQQRLALNHLYWIGQYQHTAAAEANTRLYNTVTAGVFSRISGYETLCEELAFETAQEKFHINTFHRIGYKTKIALLGKESFQQSFLSPDNKLSTRLQQKALNGLRAIANYRVSEQQSLLDMGLRKATALMLSPRRQFHSDFLRVQANQPIPTTSGGLAGITASPEFFKFLTLNWGGSPFLAAQYYCARMIANMSLKAYEQRYFRHYRSLQKADQFTPTPTAVSYFHLLDEAFHTTMSQTIAQDVYRDFPAPTVYERWVANWITKLAQQGILGGLSAVLPLTFRDDAFFLPAFYRLLTSRLFNFSKTEALHWLDRCLCHEHEGLHLNFENHQKMLTEFQDFFSRLEYLSPENQKMQVMVKGGSIERAIARNQAALATFSQVVVCT